MRRSRAVREPSRGMALPGAAPPVLATSRARALISRSCSPRSSLSSLSSRTFERKCATSPVGWSTRSCRRCTVASASARPRSAACRRSRRLPANARPLERVALGYAQVLRVVLFCFVLFCCVKGIVSLRCCELLQLCVTCRVSRARTARLTPLESCPYPGMVSVERGWDCGKGARG